MERKNGKAVKSILKVLAMLGVGVAFYKLPTYIANKWMFYKTKTRHYSQKTEEEDDV